MMKAYDRRAALRDLPELAITSSTTEEKRSGGNPGAHGV
jgi:hypothetical protein